MKIKGILRTSGFAAVSNIEIDGDQVVMVCDGPVEVDSPEFRLEVNGHVLRFGGTFTYEAGRLSGKANDVELLV